MSNKRGIPTISSDSCSKPTIEEQSLNSENSFLKEMSFNSIIDEEVRKEIEKKFKKSKTNANYVFPRKPVKNEKRTPVKPRHRYCKSNLILGKSLPVLHKQSKSSYFSCLTKKINQKVPRSASCKRNSKKSKKPGIVSGRQTPLLSHKRSSSQNSKRAKTPGLLKENQLEPSYKRTKFRSRGKDRVAEKSPQVKKPRHCYTASMEKAFPSYIIKSIIH
jgi:hypothetical protein